MCFVWSEWIRPDRELGVFYGFSGLVAVIAHDMTIQRSFKNARACAYNMMLVGCSLALLMFVQPLSLALVLTAILVFIMTFGEHAIGLKLSLSTIPLVLQARVFDGTQGGLVRPLQSVFSSRPSSCRRLISSGHSIDVSY